MSYLLLLLRNVNPKKNQLSPCFLLLSLFLSVCLCLLSLRVTELSLLVQSLERDGERWLEERSVEDTERRVEVEKEEKRMSEVERSYQSLSQAVLTLVSFTPDRINT